MRPIEKKIVVLAVIIGLILCIYVGCTYAGAKQCPPAVAEDPTSTTAPEETVPQETDNPTTGPEPTEPPARYELTPEERDLVERVVMAESGGEPFLGQMAVAQCILNACEKDGTRPEEVVVDYQYTRGRPEPSQRVRDAVAAVFDEGQTVTEEPILYFYAPAIASSEWHETQIFVMEIGGHRFFAERTH